MPEEYTTATDLPKLYQSSPFGIIGTWTDALRLHLRLDCDCHFCQLMQPPAPPSEEAFDGGSPV